MRRKMCKCGCGKFPTMGFNGYYWSCKKKSKEPVIKKKTPKKQKAPSRSQLLQQADSLFSHFIRVRDADSGGNITCVCCERVFNLADTDGDDKKIVQCLHFVDRGVYSLRFNEDNAHAGCSYCNLDMHLHPEGRAYKQYKGFLVRKIGRDRVEVMEGQRRQVNRLQTSIMLNVIDKYGTK